MKHKTWVAFLVTTILIIAGCGKLDYKKTKSGLLYKIISTKDSKGPLAKPGNIMKLYFEQRLNDSVLQTNFGKMPAYPPIEASMAGNDYNPTELFPMLRKGDSAVSVMLIDSLILKGKMPTIPPYMKRGDRITVTFKVADLFTSESAANADRAREMAVEQARQEKESATEKVKEQKVVDAFISSNKINAQKTANGVYVEIVKPGTGIQVDTGKIVSVKYRAMTFTGRTFDTNMDSSFHHPEPYDYPVGRGAVIPGLDEGVRLLKKGAKAKIYIPAVLAYGPSPVVEGGKPYENLIFEIEVLDVKDKPAVSKMPFPKLDTTQRKR